MIKQVLITGVCGFAGRHMCDYLTGLSRRPKIFGVDILNTQPANCDSFYNIDLTSEKQVEDIIKQTKPDSIIHFAGTFGTDNVQKIFRVNVLSISTLLEATRKHAPNSIVIATGSAAEYGQLESGQLPVDEQTDCRPVTLYGLSKQLATQATLYYHRTHNICTMIVRPFQLIGNGVTSRLVPGAFMEQLKDAIIKDLKVIKVGNLESWRDFLDIRDAVEAIWALCQNPTPGEIYNICSGKPVKIADLLQAMIDCCGVDVKAEVDPSRLRGGNDVTRAYGSYQKIKEHCGWEPKRSLHGTLQTMFNSKEISRSLYSEKQ
jgi:GDP-4-dehydro-6-deoxy-D-mannose reductase